MISDLEKDLSVSLVFLDGPLDSEPHPAIDGIYEGKFYSSQHYETGSANRTTGPYKTWWVV
jgi:hypothetical protein